ncbi:MAG: S-methyl-5'-thioadenosine phosphorylase [Candidatus Promineifilaceae bacterium]
MPAVEIAVIGGSGLYAMAGLTDIEEVTLTTPFGAPSDTLTLGMLRGRRIAFLPRHGRGHVLTPSEVPYRANIYALKQLGVRFVIGVSACGSLRERYAPRDIVIPDQLVDFTKGKRQATFFGRGLVAHLGVAKPFSPELSTLLANAVSAAGGRVHHGGVFITIEGPRFSTQGESELFRGWGLDIIGMTTSPEAFLAAEAEIAYACMAHVTDYDVWHATEAPVTVETVIRVLAANTELARRSIDELVRGRANWPADFPAHHAMGEALSLVGDWSAIPTSVREELEPIIGKYARP